MERLSFEFKLFGLQSLLHFSNTESSDEIIYIPVKVAASIKQSLHRAIERVELAIRAAHKIVPGFVSELEQSEIP